MRTPDLAGELKPNWPSAKKAKRYVYPRSVLLFRLDYSNSTLDRLPSKRQCYRDWVVKGGLRGPAAVQIPSQDLSGPPASGVIWTNLAMENIASAPSGKSHFLQDTQITPIFLKIYFLKFDKIGKSAI